MSLLFRWRLVAMLCLLRGATALAVTLVQPGALVRAEDRDRDGRPDLWQFYDARDRLVRVAIDTNFDGRADEDEYYVDSALIRRESDRNFDDRVDLVEEFDAATHDHVRSVVDVDFDGTADLLVLLQQGRPVLTRWADPAHVAAPAPLDRRTAARESTGADRGAIEPLSRLADPFQAETALRASVRTHDRAPLGLPTSTSPAACSIDVCATIAARPARIAYYVVPLATSPVSPSAPRGPPAVPLA